MVFFFALAANEVVESMAPGGPLHTWRRAALPVIGAAGGMVLPAALYVVYVHYAGESGLLQIGRASCRERVEDAVGAGSLKKKKEGDDGEERGTTENSTNRK